MNPASKTRHPGERYWLLSVLPLQPKGRYCYLHQDSDQEQGIKAGQDVFSSQKFGPAEGIHEVETG